MNSARTNADPQLLAAFNRGVERSRAAYRADLATAQGLCVVCEVNKPGGFVRTCVKCRQREAEAVVMTRHHLDAPDALTDGAWLPDDRMTLRWVANAAPPPARRDDLHRLIACPTCHAKVDETCRSDGGRGDGARPRRTPHRPGWLRVCAAAARRSGGSGRSATPAATPSTAPTSATT
jgi:hypothetical protein